jgi:ATP-dependent exoDNAse (exonuclease V) alpha subunit
LSVSAGVASGVTVGDKVMQITSDDEAEVCKGDVGTMKTIDTDDSELTGN